MRSFFYGLGMGILGALLWIVASVLAALGTVAEEDVPVLFTGFMVLGFIVMVLSPLAFWLVIPVWRRIRRQR